MVVGAHKLGGEIRNHGDTNTTPVLGLPYHLPWCLVLPAYSFHKMRVPLVLEDYHMLLPGKPSVGQSKEHRCTLCGLDQALWADSFSEVIPVLWQILNEIPLYL